MCRSNERARLHHMQRDRVLSSPQSSPVPCSPSSSYGLGAPSFDAQAAISCVVKAAVWIVSLSGLPGHNSSIIMAALRNAVSALSDFKIISFNFAQYLSIFLELNGGTLPSQLRRRTA